MEEVAEAEEIDTEEIGTFHINILSKGLKFIPSPVLKRAKNDLLCDWENLSRRMRLNYSFRNTENSSEKHPFKRKSEFTPEFANNAIETYLWKTKVELERLPMVNSRNNLTKNEFNSLISLKKNENIIIKKADKCSSIVVLDKHMYIKQAMTQLSSEIHYHKLSETHSKDIFNKIIDIIIPLHNMGHIDKHSLDYLTSGKEFKPGRLYMLPKTHKLSIDQINDIEKDKNLIKDINIPGRPIISMSGSPTETIAHFIDYFLREIVFQQWTYTKDSTAFINKIQELKLPFEFIMASFDVTSMYTYMEHSEIVNAIDRAWNKLRSCNFKMKIPPIQSMLELIRIILKNNEFEFNGELFRQKIGVPMGSPLSPSLTDIRMFEIINEILNKFTMRDKIMHLSVYRDDAFLIFKGTKAELTEFFDISNSIHPLLKFTFDINCQIGIGILSKEMQPLRVFMRDLP
ncbi:unnamed protein product [Mytilus edulis]|uniref:Reverse transcriptase domain-containing protein n=1 Tax=Mytilus edulis TaxID=6550 RepID=A0A8S3S593_MYTED|nr:unnamed protein product [Mytilus edulis]